MTDRLKTTEMTIEEAKDLITEWNQIVLDETCPPSAVASGDYARIERELRQVLALIDTLASLAARGV